MKVKRGTTDVRTPTEESTGLVLQYLHDRESVFFECDSVGGKKKIE